MGEAYFYHLTRQSINEALVPLLNKCLDNSWRVLVRGNDLGLLKVLDEKLWEGGDNVFLPHGLLGGPHDMDQPILLAPEGQTPPHDCLICISGANLTCEEVSLAKRVCIVFQGDSSTDVEHARNQWKALADEGLAAKYWDQSSGSWELKAETPAK